MLTSVSCSLPSLSTLNNAKPAAVSKRSNIVRDLAAGCWREHGAQCCCTLKRMAT